MCSCRACWAGSFRVPEQIDAPLPGAVHAAGDRRRQRRRAAAGVHQRRRAVRRPGAERLAGVLGARRRWPAARATRRCSSATSARPTWRSPSSTAPATMCAPPSGHNGTWALEPSPLNAVSRRRRRHRHRAPAGGDGRRRRRHCRLGRRRDTSTPAACGGSRRAWSIEQADAPLPGCSELSADDPSGRRRRRLVVRRRRLSGGALVRRAAPAAGTDEPPSRLGLRRHQADRRARDAAPLMGPSSRRL